LENTSLGLFWQFSKEEKIVFAKHGLTKKIKNSNKK
jgi:hypothetical protein